MTRHDAKPFKRDRSGHAKVTNEELFFDLVYAFASPSSRIRLLENLTPIGAVQTLVLWFAVWLGWQYTSWVTNWLNPENVGMRIMLFALMLLGLAMSSAIRRLRRQAAWPSPAATPRSRSGAAPIVLVRPARRRRAAPELHAHLRLAVHLGVLVDRGRTVGGEARLAFWIGRRRVRILLADDRLLAARPRPLRDVRLDHRRPPPRRTLPALRDRRARRIDPRHRRRRSRVAEHPGVPTIVALVVALHRQRRDVVDLLRHRQRARHARDHAFGRPGRIGAYFHYIHVTLIAGIIVAAVADELVIHHPDHHVDLATALVLIGGPLIYLLGGAAYKRVVYGWVPPSHIAGAVVLMLLFPLSFATDRLMVGGLTSLVLMIVAAWQSLSAPALPAGHRTG
jgi:hypothetical protein